MTTKPSLEMTAKQSSDNFCPDFPSQYHGYVGIFLTLGFFQLINLAVIRAGPPKRLKGDFFRWKNLFISWINAVIVGTGVLLSFWLYPEIMENLFDYNNWFIYALVVFSLGYFIYDFLDIICAGELFSNWEVITHHIAVILILGHDVATCSFIAFTMIALLTEVNSIFLHLRKLMQLNQVDYSGLPYRIVCLVNLVSFVPCRFVPTFATFYALIFSKDQMMPTLHMLLSISTPFLLLIFCFLFWRLFKSDVLRSWRSKSKKPHWNKETKEDMHLNLSKKENNNFTNGAGLKCKNM